MPEGLVDCKLIEADCEIGKVTMNGTAWIRTGVGVGDGSILENCVLLEGASIGRRCTLRNTLVLPGVRIPECTDASDKYLSVF